MNDCLWHLSVKGGACKQSWGIARRNLAGWGLWKVDKAFYEALPESPVSPKATLSSEDVSLCVACARK